MLEIKAKVKAPKAAYGIKTGGRLTLSFEERTKSGLRTRLDSGEEATLMLPRGEVLRGGDLVTASDGRVIEILSRKENLLHVECKGPTALAKVAYHLGHRHVPVEVGDDYLRIAADPALEDMVKKLGAKVSLLEAPFEPEAGSQEQGHDHEHAHDHDHEHCDHDHHHHHHHHHK